MRRVTLPLILLLLFVNALVPLATSARYWSPDPPTETESTGNITFQPNMIPFLNVTDRPADKPESFRFEWNGNRFDIELFFNATLYYEKLGYNITRLWSLRDFEDDFNATVDYVVKRNASAIQFGWYCERVEAISDFVHEAWFKIEDTQPFDYDEIELEEIAVVDPEISFNITRFHLPDNLVLTFEDLNYKGFSIGRQNRTAICVKGFHGKRSWNLDPITYSGGIMTVVGETGAGDSWTNAYNFWDLWNASDANGWLVANKTESGENTQYDFGCRVVIGDGSTPTFFWDVKKQVTWNSTSCSARYQNVMDVKNNGHLRYGEVTHTDDKATKDGVSSIILVDLYDIYHVNGDDGGDIALYSSHFQSVAYRNGIGGYDARIWGCILNTVDLGADLFDADIYNVIVSTAYYGFRECSFASCDRLVVQDTVFYATIYRDYTMDLMNLKLVEPATYTFSGYKITSDKHFVNPDVDQWTFYWVATSTAEVYRQYTVDLFVCFPNGTAINGTATGARVIIQHYGQGGGINYNQTLGTDGTISTQTLSRSFYNITGGDTEYSYNPYNLYIYNVTDYDDYSMNFTLAQKEDLTISLTATDTYGPTAFFTHKPDASFPLNTVYFYGYHSTDPDGSISSYSWDFGDGNTGSGANTTHSYSTDGTYTITLNVTDDDGNSDTYSTSMHVYWGWNPTPSKEDGTITLPEGVTFLLYDFRYYITIDGIVGNYLDVEGDIYLQNPEDYPINATANYAITSADGMSTHVYPKLIEVPVGTSHHAFHLMFYLDDASQDQQEYTFEVTVEYDGGILGRTTQKITVGNAIPVIRWLATWIVIGIIIIIIAAFAYGLWQLSQKKEGSA